MADCKGRVVNTKSESKENECLPSEFMVTRTFEIERRYESSMVLETAVSYHVQGRLGTYLFNRMTYLVRCLC